MKEYLLKVFSGDNIASWGRLICTILVFWIIATSTWIMINQAASALAIPAIPETWKDLIVTLFGISKGGDVIKAFAAVKGADTNASPV